jgi:prepilin-type N-terminal cleavage/methylation domain-containing protein
MNSTKRKSGLSLIEIMLSLAIFAIILLPVFMTFSSGNKNIMITETEFRAHTAALEIMEQIISLPFELIPVGKFSSRQIKSDDPENPSPIPFNVTANSSFQPELEITPVKKNDKVRFKKISVIMKFPAAKTDKRERKIELKTLVANEEI